MGLILFDYTNDSSIKSTITTTLSVACLFDGYLTELTSYQQFSRRPYLTDKRKSISNNMSIPLISGTCLFDGYLTGTQSIRQLFGDEMENIINELNEALAA